MRPTRPRRRGVTLLELQVAMIVLGVAVAGLCPLVVMQARLARKLETQPVGADNAQILRGVRIIEGAPYSGQGFAAAPPPTALLPQPDAWVRRLGIAATFAATASPQSYTLVPVQVTLDDALPGFASSGWSTGTDPSANGGGYHAVAAGSAAAPATWTFTGLVPGRYHVMASWVAGSRNAPDATYTFADSSEVPIAVPVNQQATPGGAPAWTDLGIYHLDPTFAVSLGPSQNGRVVADGLQVVPAGAANAVTITTAAAPTDTGATVRVKVVAP